MISAKEAAERTGMSKAGIVKALRTGKVSGTKNDNGEWEIDPVELFRVYPPLPTGEHSRAEVGSDPVVTQVEHLQTQLVLMREIIDSQAATIRILTARLEAQDKVTLLLTDSQHPAKSWWQRLVGK